MPELTREQKLKLLEKLSPRLQELMTSEDTGAVLLYLGQKYHLSDHQVRLLSKILGDVILGILPVTNLSLEISIKAAVDIQTANSLVQDLNDLILSPKPTPASTPAPATLAAPMPVMHTPAIPQAPVSLAQRNRVDQYREPMMPPEIVDLRKTPPPLMPMPVVPAPIPPRPPMPTPTPKVGAPTPPRAGVGVLPVAPSPIPPSPRPAPPLTFTKPVEPPKSMPLIEAEPHRIATLPQVLPTEKPTTDLPKPQFILRPPGLEPTDFPRDVLDLRKDKGEF